MHACADGHVTAVVAVAFLEGGASSERCAALSADSRGRLLFHAVSSYLSLTAMLAGARARACMPSQLLWPSSAISVHIVDRLQDGLAHVPAPLADGRIWTESVAQHCLYVS